MKLHNPLLFLPGSSRSVWHLKGSCTLWHIISTSFSFMTNVSVHGYTIFCLSIHPLMDIWILLTFWLLWIIQLWTFKYKFFYGHIFPVLLGIYLGVELLGPMFNSRVQPSEETSGLSIHFPHAVLLCIRASYCNEVNLPMSSLVFVLWYLI